MKLLRSVVAYQRGDTVRYDTFMGAVAAWVIKNGNDPVTIRMVGDDRDFEVSADDIQLIDEDEFCGGCGQIGCGHG